MKLKYIIEPQLRDMGIKSTMVAEVTEVVVQNHNDELEGIKQATAAEVLRISDAAIDSNPILESYRELVRTTGRSLKKFPPAAESLLLQIRRLGRFPKINTVVDSYNIVVARNFLALGVHDLARLGNVIRFRLSEGEEPFRSVGSPNEKRTQRGDFVYSDEHQLLAWLDSKDSEHVKISLGTTDLVMVIQGTAKTSRQYVQDTIEQACLLITRFSGGNYEVAAVD